MKTLSSLTAICLSFAAIGCSGGDGSGGADRPETAPVTVTINYKGAAVEGATVTFSPKTRPGGTAAYGKTDSSGSVKLNAFPDKEGVVPGEYDVLVTKMEVKAGSGVSMDDPNYDGGESAEDSAPPKSLIPEKYNAAATSGLTASVKAGQDNPFTFDLED